MENNKYFTPDIEDIHVGYECEIKEEIWQKLIVDKYMQLNALNKQILANIIRVPFLTQEQIEAEGWTQAITEYHGDINYENMSVIFTKENVNYMLGYNFTTKLLSLMVRDPSLKSGIKGQYVEYYKTPRFNGTCKDINTFRKICKLLEI